MNYRRGTIILVLTFFFSHLAHAEQTKPTKESFSAIMVATGNVKGMSNAQITIARWTTDAEREELVKAVLEKGQEELVKRLEKQEECGFIRLPNTLGLRLRYAREFRKGNIRRIILATDRPMGFWEVRNNGRSVDYAVTLVELVLDESTGKGQGTMAPAAKLKIDKESRTLEIETLGLQPVRFTSVTKSD
jgi:hypothetical protein